ncbi:hypothetical protein EDD30_2619 [Couchioplanes caeruleus]|uniref:Uncharacterized protein n=1 Tax=Couchioplanes caeruleus TaxID=56438 RepID=A0A3N1GHP1_9ACTN|nr:hypothetical protein EDD30_2619 [Couchioplanes caeruleus]
MAPNERTVRALRPLTEGTIEVWTNRQWDIANSGPAD